MNRFNESFEKPDRLNELAILLTDLMPDGIYQYVCN